MSHGRPTRITTERLPIKLWLREDQMDPGALAQAKDLANLPFAFHHIAIMPDTHQGYGMPIGAVLATQGAIIPNAVGVDIGCGMCSLRTNLTDIDIRDLRAIVQRIRDTIPVGFKRHTQAQDAAYMPELSGELPIVRREYDNALYQIGTLGGGNHFIEIQKGSDGFIWIMIHSGSRNIGYSVATHYHERALAQTKSAPLDVPEELAYLPKSSDDYQLYKEEMTYCLAFALANRKLMMERAQQAFEAVLPEVTFHDFINKHHNFAATEKHFGESVLVHRKGATRARKGEWGMIPGSQGTCSYLVTGKGEPLSFESCAHGAGRIMSRAQARKRLNLQDEVQALKKRGIIHAIRNQRDLDEAPGSYKDIDEVMRNQTDLVEVQVELQPLAVVKG